jgi:hypothetical protein
VGRPAGRCLRLTALATPTRELITTLTATDEGQLSSIHTVASGREMNIRENPS